ncbi:MAG: DUF84 family protein [Nanoarchaeota archaeon]
MRIYVGYGDPIEKQAAEEIAPLLIDNECVNVFSIVYSILTSEPKSLDDLFLGALSRAGRAFRGDSKLSFGIVSGLWSYDGASSGCFYSTLCAVYDGKTRAVPGVSAAFDVPEVIVDCLDQGASDINEACYQAGLLERSQSIDLLGGIIGALTGGRVTRKDMVKQAIEMGFMHFNQRELYSQRGNKFLRS